MIGRYVPPVRCSYSREQACHAYWKACADIGLTPTVPLVTVLVAHGALECGNFSSGLWNNGIANIKAGEQWPGDYTCVTVNEILKGADGKYHERWFSPAGELTASPAKGGVLKDPANLTATPPGHPQTRMRAYASLDDAIEDKIRFLLSARWLPCLDFAKRGDASGYVRAIRARGYFTAYAGQPDPCPYETQVVSLTKSYRPKVEAVAAGIVLPIAEPVFDASPVAPVRHNLLDPETIQRLEVMQAEWLDEQMHAPRERDRDPILP